MKPNEVVFNFCRYIYNYMAAANQGFALETSVLKLILDQQLQTEPAAFYFCILLKDSALSIWSTRFRGLI